MCRRGFFAAGGTCIVSAFPSCPVWVQKVQLTSFPLFSLHDVAICGCGRSILLSIEGLPDWHSCFNAAVSHPFHSSVRYLGTWPHHWVHPSINPPCEFIDLFLHIARRANDHVLGIDCLGICICYRVFKTSRRYVKIYFSTSGLTSLISISAAAPVSALPNGCSLLFESKIVWVCLMILLVCETREYCLKCVTVSLINFISVIECDPYESHPSRSIQTCFQSFIGHLICPDFPAARGVSPMLMIMLRDGVYYYMAVLGNSISQITVVAKVMTHFVALAVVTIVNIFVIFFTRVGTILSANPLCGTDTPYPG